MFAPYRPAFWETGIESGEAVFGIVQQVKPAVVIAVDTLAAGDPARMATTVQLGNTGIAPGGGVGNRRLALDERRWACRYWRWACRWWCVPIHCLKEGSKG